MKMKNENGITLIALVITIIVLLILAGVAIAMLSGENGILGKAKESASHTALGAAKDEVYVDAQEALTQYYENTYVSNSATSYNKDELNNAIKDAIDNTYADGKVTATKGDSNVTLNYTADGTTVEGTLKDGSISWGDFSK